MNNIIKKPVISEKSMQLTKMGMFTFIVDGDARKEAIKKAVESKFGVNVTAIKTMNFKSEIKQQRSKKGVFEISGFKKAVVVLKEGQKIALFETESKEKKVEKVDEVKEKRSLLKGTKVKIEKQTDKKKEKDGKN